MTENSYEIISDIVNDIKNLYENREGSQSDVAKQINKKYNTHLTTENISDVTQQLGYIHTVKRLKEKTVIIFLDESFREHIS